MAFDKAAFRVSFPEFSDVAKYPDTMLDTWLVGAGLYVSQVKWTTYYTLGMSLVLAHFIALAYNNKIGEPGTATGRVASEAAGSVNVTYDALNTVEDKAGQWNQTTYGQQYVRMARMIGGCAVQVS